LLENFDFLHMDHASSGTATCGANWHLYGRVGALDAHSRTKGFFVVIASEYRFQP